MELIKAKTIITKNKKPSAWFGGDYNMNIYRGCSHGCIYCDSRSDCYGDTNFSKVKIKEDALLTIRNDLRRKVKKGVVATGAMSDPYNPLEKEYKLTRNALELISAYGFGTTISTKSDLILRDMDVLEEIKAQNPVNIQVTITTHNEELCKIIEPHVSSAKERYNIIRELSHRGICTGVLLMPILPFINDSDENIYAIIENAHSAGAKFIYPMFGVTLRDNQREYFYGKLEKNFPQMKEKYIKSFGNNYTCFSRRNSKLYELFKNECEKRGILYKMSDIIKFYKMGYGDTQLSFL